VADATYFNDANNHAIAWRIDGSEFGDTASSIYIAHNAWSAQVNFALPWPGAGKSWYRVTDTCTWAEGAAQVQAPGTEVLVGGENTSYGLCGRGTLLLIAK
jgi:glycogen operon protein